MTGNIKTISPLVERLRRLIKQRAHIVELNEISFIDKDGEKLLRLLVSEGAQCIATGVYINHLQRFPTLAGEA
jgi:hypothetical protein